MKNTFLKISFFLYAIVLCSCNRDGVDCEDFFRSSVDDIIALYGAEDIADALEIAELTEGSIIQLNPAMNGKAPYNLGLGGTISDRWLESTADTDDEFGLLLLDGVPYNRLGNETELPGPSNDPNGVHQVFDGQAHQIILKNKNDTQVLMDTSCVLPRSFFLDSQPDTFVSKSNIGLHISWSPLTNGESVFITYHIPLGGYNENVAGKTDESVFKVFKTEDKGNFLIPLEEISDHTGYLASIHIYRYKAMNVQDNRNPSRQNAVILSTSWSQVILL